MAGLSADIVPDIHVLHLYQGVEAFNQNDFETALVEFEMAASIRRSGYATWNRAVTLLSLGRYREGFADYAAWRKIFCKEMTPVARQLYEILPHWDGTPGQDVIILHEQGFGDTIQLLRFVPIVKAMSRSVALEMPAPLKRLASQLAPEPDGNGYVATTYDLMTLLAMTQETIPPPPYLRPDPILREKWTRRIGDGGRRRIGIVWSVKLGSDGEHPNAKREAPLDLFIHYLPDCELYSLQTQEQEEANARGIRAFDFDDFADVAALMSLLDGIVSVDTAALHVAGALGHPNVCALLPYAATWRWLNGNWYPQVKQCRCTSPGNWISAFAQIDGQRFNNPRH
jgi:hypothetical protein